MKSDAQVCAFHEPRFSKQHPLLLNTHFHPFGPFGRVYRGAGVPVCLHAVLALNSHRQAGISTLPCLFTVRVAVAAADRHVMLGVTLVNLNVHSCCCH